MNQMDDGCGNIELSAPVDSVSFSSVINQDCSDVGVFCDPDSVWIPSTGNFVAFIFKFLFGNGLTF